MNTVPQERMANSQPFSDSEMFMDSRLRALLSGIFWSCC
jgi:hypothetical protein